MAHLTIYVDGFEIGRGIVDEPQLLAQAVAQMMESFDGPPTDRFLEELASEMTSEDVAWLNELVYRIEGEVEKADA
jgi:hypothetical protein